MTREAEAAELERLAREAEARKREQVSQYFLICLVENCVKKVGCCLYGFCVLYLLFPLLKNFDFDVFRLRHP